VARIKSGIPRSQTTETPGGYPVLEVVPGFHSIPARSVTGEADDPIGRSAKFERAGKLGQKTIFAFRHQFRCPRPMFCHPLSTRSQQADTATTSGPRLRVAVRSTSRRRRRSPKRHTRGRDIPRRRRVFAKRPPSPFCTPGYAYDPAFERPLHQATEFSWLETRHGWVRARLPDDSEGWVRECDGMQVP
jgi:hypothetical protein